MSLNLADYKTKARSALKLFWAGRKAAVRKQPSTGNMKGFIDLITDIVRANGLHTAEIVLKNRLLSLPGHFSPTRLWDVLVMNQGRLIAAIELKSLVGASLGKKLDSCFEESLSNTMDLRAAYRKGSLGRNRRPFVGHLGIIENSVASRMPVKEVYSLLYPLDPVYRDTSYATQYDIFCKKMMVEGLYTSASVILASREDAKSGRYSELDEMTGLASFVATLAAYVAMEATP